MLLTSPLEHIYLILDQDLFECAKTGLYVVDLILECANYECAKNGK